MTPAAAGRRRARSVSLGLVLVVAAAPAGVRDRPSRSSDGAVSGAYCADAVVRDWWDDGEIAVVYPRRCYRQALEAIPSSRLSKEPHATLVRRLGSAGE